MIKSITMALLAGSIALGITAIGAEAGNIEKMKKMQVTGTSLDIPTVAQDPKKAAAIRKTLKRIKLPAGFKIDLYATASERWPVVGTDIPIDDVIAADDDDVWPILRHGRDCK